MTQALDIKVGSFKQNLKVRFANRHGFITGATGTGKSTTIASLIEAFSEAGVSTFVSDVKGDLSGLANPTDVANPLPVLFWDIFGQNGRELQVSLKALGAPLLAKVLELSDAQEGVLAIAFQVWADLELQLNTFTDLRRALDYVIQNGDQLTQYGYVTQASVATILRRLLVLETAGTDRLFGRTNLDVNEFIGTDRNGRGLVNVLSAEKLISSPEAYASFLFFLIKNLYDTLPEVGDQDKPKIVFFFDEAHLLFSNAPKHLLQAIETTVRLIRSKGVGIYFISQSPTDIPEAVLRQLSNKIQHALRANTANDQKLIKAAANSFLPNPAFSTFTAIQNIGIGEALVSFLDNRGVPNVVEKGLVQAPVLCRLGSISAAQRKAWIDVAPYKTAYVAPVRQAPVVRNTAAVAAQAAVEKPSLSFLDKALAGILGAFAVVEVAERIDRNR